jgi:hypothetical protein
MILALTPDRSHYFDSLKQHLNYPLVFISKPDINYVLKYRPVAVLFLSDWTYELKSFIDYCRENRIPTILMLDGIIEWKHFFENPKWSFDGNEAPYFPVYCDKVFVPGSSTDRFLAFFGSAGKCEITGLPRLDYHKKKQTRKPIINNRKVIGVMSGNTAGYTKNQIEESKRMFNDIYHWSRSNPNIEVRWRLRKGFDKLLDFNVENDNSSSLDKYLLNLNAVICQPSTVAYEAMVYELPVAIADYSIAPNYMHAAWEIKSPSSIPQIVNELLNPSILKMQLQQQLLEDNMAFVGRSSEIASMVINNIVAHVNKLQNNQWIFPVGMVDSVINNNDYLVKKTALINLFQNRINYFSEDYLLEEEVIKLKNSNVRLNKKLKSRNLGHWLSIIIIKLYNYFIRLKPNN